MLSKTYTFLKGAVVVLAEAILIKQWGAVLYDFTNHGDSLTKEENTMRKRILSALLALCMVLTMAPAAFAADVTVSTAEELATAIENAADGETVTLAGDVDLASSYITFDKADCEVILDLGGHKLTKSSGANGITILVKAGTLTIQNGTIETTSLNSAGQGAINVEADCSADQQAVYATLVVKEDVTINSSSYTGIGVFGNVAQVDVYGNVNGLYYGVAGNGTDNATTNFGGTVINIYDGAKIGHTDPNDGVGIFQSQEGTLNIHGGEITGLVGVQVCSGTANIYGGTITATGANTLTDYKYASSGNVVDGAALSIINRSGYPGNINVNVYDGEFISEQGDAILEYTSNADCDNIENINIEGGAFKGADEAQAINVQLGTSDTAKPVVSGGNFSSNVSSYVPSGMTATQNEEGVYTIAANEDAEASIGKAVYNTLAEALKAAKSGDTVTLRKDVTVTNENDLGYGTSVVNVPAGVTLDGAENSIIAGEGFVQKDGKNNNSIVGAEAGAAIKNLSIIGTANTKHGINIFEEGTVDNPVVIENVTIKDCGNAGITVNKSVVKASGITTENNAWGSINVDKGSTFTLDGTNSLGENVQVWSDDANEESGSSITVNDENLTGVTGVGANLQGFLYYTDDVSKLGEAYNEDTKTVYESLTAALDAAQANETVHAVKDAALADLDEVAADVTLVVDPDVKLTIGDGSGTLTNNGTIENHGTISGTVDNGENGKEETYFTATFTIKPDGADLVVTDEEGNAVSAFEEGKYSLKKDAEYSYTVTATGYNKKSGKVTLTDNETIDVTLSRKSSGGSSSSSSTNTITAANTNNGSVRISPSRAAEGATVTVTVTPDNGYELDRLTASANGSNIRLTDAGDGKYTFTMPSGNVTVTATFTQTNAGSELPFTDVARNAYYYDSVKWAVDNNITNGSSATAFSPETACTRAQMVTFLWRAAGSPKASTSNPFTDLDTSAYYYEAVLWAVEKGVTTGTTETTFSPDAVVSRAQVVTFLNRYDGSTASEGSNPFTDVSSDAYYAGAVNWAVANNVTTGTTATTFSPDEDCTRAQIVTFMYRALVD